MVASTLFTVFGLGALCWVMFNLAVYALPFAIGLISGLYLHDSGQGVFLSIIAGLFIGGFVAALGENGSAKVGHGSGVIISLRAT